MSVRKVSVREARQHLRRLLDEVQAGDQVIALRRGVEVGRLIPPERAPSLDSLRASIKLRGRPLSRAIVEIRRSRR